MVRVSERRGANAITRRRARTAGVEASGPVGVKETLQSRTDPVGQCDLAPGIGGHAHVAQARRDEDLVVTADVDLGGDRGAPEPRDPRDERELVVELRGRSKAELRVGDDRVEAPLDHLLPGPHGLAPQLGERDVAVEEVVRVEDDALRVALAVAHAQRIHERLGHRAHTLSPQRRGGGSSALVARLRERERCTICEMRAGTYSIVARDRDTGELGVAVQSHWFSVGSVVSWARPGVGAVATQSVAEVAHGPNALERLAEGLGAAGAPVAAPRP